MPIADSLVSADYTRLDRLEVTFQLPAGDGLGKAAPLPAAGGDEVVDEGGAEEIARDLRGGQAIGGLRQVARQHGRGLILVAAAGDGRSQVQPLLDAVEAAGERGRERQV